MRSVPMRVNDVTRAGTSLGLSGFLPDGARGVSRMHREIVMVDKDRSEGALTKVAGKLKEAVGKLTGDEKTKVEGQTDQAKGTVQNAVGGVKDALKDK